MNMSYCRFHNTLLDLGDCVNALWDGEELSESEQRAAEQLRNLCEEYLEAYGQWLEMP